MATPEQRVRAVRESLGSTSASSNRVPLSKQKTVDQVLADMGTQAKSSVQPVKRPKRPDVPEKSVMQNVSEFINDTPALKTTLGVLGSAGGAVTDQIANWTDQNLDANDIPLWGSIKNFGQGVSDYYKDNPWYKAPLAPIAGLANVGLSAKTGSDIVKNSYALGSRLAGEDKESSKRIAEQWAQQHPYFSKGTGLVADIAFDPLNLVSFGGISAAKAGARAATNEALDVAKNYGVQAAKKGAEQSVPDLVYEATKAKYENMGNLPVIRKGTVAASDRIEQLATKAKKNAQKRISDARKVAENDARNALISWDAPFTNFTKTIVSKPAFMKSRAIALGDDARKIVSALFNGIDEEKVDNFLRSEYGVNDAGDLTLEQIRDLQSRMQDISPTVSNTFGLESKYKSNMVDSIPVSEKVDFDFDKFISQYSPEVQRIAQNLLKQGATNDEVIAELPNLIRQYPRQFNQAAKDTADQIVANAPKQLPSDITDKLDQIFYYNQIGKGKNKLSYENLFNATLDAYNSGRYTPEQIGSDLDAMLAQTKAPLEKAEKSRFKKETKTAAQVTQENERLTKEYENALAKYNAAKEAQKAAKADKTANAQVKKQRLADEVAKWEKKVAEIKAKHDSFKKANDEWLNSLDYLLKGSRPAEQLATKAPESPILDAVNVSKEEMQDALRRYAHAEALNKNGNRTVNLDSAPYTKAYHDNLSEATKMVNELIRVGKTKEAVDLINKMASDAEKTLASNKYYSQNGKIRKTFLYSSELATQGQSYKYLPDTKNNVERMIENGVPEDAAAIIDEIVHYTMEGKKLNKTETATKNALQQIQNDLINSVKTKIDDGDPYNTYLETELAKAKIGASEKVGTGEFEVALAPAWKIRVGEGLPEELVDKVSELSLRLAAEDAKGVVLSKKMTEKEYKEFFAKANKTRYSHADKIIKDIKQSGKSVDELLEDLKQQIKDVYNRSTPSDASRRYLKDPAVQPRRQSEKMAVSLPEERLYKAPEATKPIPVAETPELLDIPTSSKQSVTPTSVPKQDAPLPENLVASKPDLPPVELPLKPTTKSPEVSSAKNLAENVEKVLKPTKPKLQLVPKVNPANLAGVPKEKLKELAELRKNLQPTAPKPVIQLLDRKLSSEIDKFARNLEKQPASKIVKSMKPLDEPMDIGVRKVKKGAEPVRTKQLNFQALKQESPFVSSLNGDSPMMEWLKQKAFFKMFNARSLGTGNSFIDHYGSLIQDTKTRISGEVRYMSRDLAKIQKVAGELKPDEMKAAQYILENKFPERLAGEEASYRANPKVQELVSLTKNLLQYLGKEEMASGVLSRMMQDYFPHMLKFNDEKLKSFTEKYLNDPDLRTLAKGLSQKAGFSKMRKGLPTLADYDDLVDNLMKKRDQATSDNLRKYYDNKINDLTDLFNRDTVDVLASRVYQSVRSRAMKDLYKQMVSDQLIRYGTGGSGYKRLSDDEAKLLGINNKEKVYMHNEVLDGLRNIEGMFTDSKMNEFFKTAEDATRLFKLTTTVLIPKHYFNNLLGNLFNNGLAGVKFESYKEATSLLNKIKNNTLTPAEQKEVLEMYRQGVIGQGHNAEFRKMEFTDEKQVMRRIYDWTMQTWYAKNLMHTGEAIDDWSRLALYLHGKKVTGSAQSAADTVRKYLFNYHEITNADRIVRSTMIPFWLWTRNNLPLQLENILKQPRYYLTWEKIREATFDDNQLADEPEYIREKGINLFGHKFFINLPMYDSYTINGVKGTSSNILNMANPVLGSLVELGTNTNTFTGGKLDKEVGKRNGATDYSAESLGKYLLGQYGGAIGAEGMDIYKNVIQDKTLTPSQQLVRSIGSLLAGRELLNK